VGKRLKGILLRAIEWLVIAKIYKSIHKSGIMELSKEELSILNATIARVIKEGFGSVEIQIQDHKIVHVKYSINRQIERN